MSAAVVISGVTPRVVKVQQTGLQGPAGTSTALPAVYTPVNAGHAITETDREVYVGHSGLLGDVTDPLPAAPNTGMRATVADEDNSLAAHNITIDAGAKHIHIGGVDVGTTYQMNAGNRPGVGGSLTLMYQGAFWRDV